MNRTVGNRIITVITFISIIIGTYGIVSIVNIELPPHLAQAGPWQFLTNLSLVVSLVIFIIGFLAHITKSDALFELKNKIHPIGLALESIVAGVYWPLRLFFLHLLTKNPSKYMIPLKVDLSIHLMPVVSLLIDYLIFMPRWTLSTRGALAIVSALTTAYWVLLSKLIDVSSGAEYPYVFLNVENDHLRMAIFSIVGLTAFLQFLAMRKVYDWIVKTSDKEVDIKGEKESIIESKKAI